MPDLERLTNRALSGKATPRDLEHIGLALTAVPELQKAVSDFGFRIIGGRESVNPKSKILQS
jgi:DNA mismatch repair ATPase MutS